MSMIQISNLSFTYQGSFTPVFQNVSLTLDTSWAPGAYWAQRPGQNHPIAPIAGRAWPLRRPYTGARFRFLYFPFAVADPSLSAQEIAYALCPNLALWELKRELSLLEVKEEALHQAFSSLSFGERTKVMLAVLFLHPHAFLLIDEPTNHLDMHARQVVARYLHSKQGFLLVSQ